jgi:hypothetical protein
MVPHFVPVGTNMRSLDQILECLATGIIRTSHCIGDLLSIHCANIISLVETRDTKESESSSISLALFGQRRVAFYFLWLGISGLRGEEGMTEGR